MGTNWTEQQCAVIDNRGGTLLVSAAAGSGKTAVLVERVLRRVSDPENPCDIDSFLIVTYTRAAAGEMRGKIAEALTELVTGHPDNVHLRRQLMLVHRAQITTVHAYCMSLLREHYNELGLPPDFGMLDESQAEHIRTEVLEEVLERRYGQQDEGFDLLADVMGAGRDDKKLMDVVLETYQTLQCSPNPRAELMRYRDSFCTPFDRFADTPWGQELIEKAASMTECGLRILRSAMDEMDTDPDLKEKYRPAFEQDERDAKTLLTLLRDGAWDAAAEQCSALIRKRKRLGAMRKYPDPEFLQRLKDMRELWKSLSKEISEKVLCLKEEEIREDFERMAPAVAALCDTVQEFSDAFYAEKQRRALLDFNDLEHNALALLVEEDGSPTRLAQEIHFTEIMVDEYQDTNAVQDAIFRAVSEDEKNIFMVGDVKQSIYRFRQANPGIFLQKYKTFRDAEGVFDDTPRRIVLSKNFRSRPQVLRSVNTLFANIMSEQLGDLDYTESEALYPGAVYPDSPQDYRTELCLLETGSDDEDAPARIQLEADFCARKIRGMLDSGFKVTDKETRQLRPCRPEDFVILMRSLSMRMPIYQKALLRYGITASGDAEDEIFQTPEVLTALSLLETLDNPHQDLPLLAVLRSPLFGFSEEELAEIRLEHPDGDYYTAVRAAAETRENVRAFCEKLDTWRLIAADLSVHELLAQLLDETDAMAVYGAMPGGASRQRNLTVLLQRAVQFESGASRGLFAFVRAMRDLREQGRGMTASGDADAADAVRIMTIHKSKGLEFPIVILADCSKKFNETDLHRPVLLHEQLGIAMKCRDTGRGLEYDGADRMALSSRIRQENVSEELRVLYVAMTRAKEKLILTASFDNLEKTVRSWEVLASMNPIPPYALASARQYSTWIGVTMLCHPSMHLLRALCVSPPEVRLPEDHSWTVQMIPYTQIGQELEPDVVDLESPDLLADTVEVPELIPYPAEALASLPSKLTATAIAAGFKAEEAGEGAVQPRRPSGSLRRPCFVRSERKMTPAEIGTAHHLFLQFCDFDRCAQPGGCAQERDRLRDRHILRAEQADCISLPAIERFFSSALFAQMKQSGDYRREFKFSVLVPASEYFPEAAELPAEEVLLQGVVDCMYETADGIVIVDFKTDRVRPGQETERAARYRPQLEAYRRAVQEVFGRPVCGCVLFFLHTGQTVHIK